MRRALRWAVRIVLGLIALVTLATIALVITLHTAWARDKIRVRVEAALAASFPGGAKIGRLEGTPLGELVAYDVELDSIDHQPLVKIGELDVDLALTPLLGKTARVDRLELDDVVVTPTGSPRTPEGPPQPETAGTTWSVELPEIEVHRARIVPIAGRPGDEISALEATARVALPAGRPITAIVGLRASWRGQPVSIMAAVQDDRGAITVPFATTSVAGSGLVAAGVALTSKLTAFRGVVMGHATVADVARFTAAALPADASFSAIARGDLTDLFAALGASQLRAFAKVDVLARSAIAVVSVVSPDFAALDRGALVGSGALVAALEGSLGPDWKPSARGLVSIAGEAAHRPMTRAVVAVDGSAAGGNVIAGAADEAGIAAAVDADLTRDASGIAVVRSHAVATAPELAFEDGSAAVRADVATTGRIWPATDLHVTGTIGATNVRVARARVRDVSVALDVHSIPDHSEGDLEISLVGARYGATRIPAIGFDAHGFYTRATGDLSATLVSNELGVAKIVPGLGGRASARVELARRAGEWSGKLAATGRDLVIAEDTPPVDVRVDGTLSGRRLATRATIIGAQLGSATAVLDVDGPRDITDVAAWRGLGRSAVHEARLAIDQFDGTQLGMPVRVDGELHVSARDAGGELDASGLEGKGHSATATIALANAPDGATATVTAVVDRVATAHATIDLAFVRRMFDPTAWKTLGRGVVRGGMVHVDEIRVDPELLARYGVGVPLNARVTADAKIGSAGTTLQVSADVRDLIGGPLAQPVEIHAESLAEDGAATLSIVARSGSLELVEVRGHAPLALDHLQLAALRALPIQATLTVPTLQARDLLAIVGRSDLQTGTVEGTITATGTAGAPIADATFSAANVTTVPGIQGSKPSALHDLAVTGHYEPGRVRADVTGHEEGGGELVASAHGDPRSLRTLAGTLAATRFELAPVTAFAPGIARAISGTVDGKLALRGLDPDTGDISGSLHITEARLPIASTIGVLRRADVKIAIANHVITVDADGKLGTGTVKGNAKIALRGSSPAHADITLALRKISPIASIEPEISADVTAGMTYQDRRWTGDIKVQHGSIHVESNRGQKLLEVGAPADIDFVDAAAPAKPKGPVHIAAPSAPWLVASISIEPVELVVKDFAIVQQLRATLAGKLRLSYGGGVALDGTIETRRGDVDIFGRSYQIDRGQIAFDGPLDPRLDIRLVHDFTDLTLTAQLSGRASAVNLALSGTPAIYSPTQLYGFFLGGEPGGDPSDATKNAAVGASASVGSALLFSGIGKYLPFKPDTLGYQAATDTTSATVKAGIWISNNFFAQGNHHIDPLPDENSNEAQFEYYFRRHLLGGTLFLQGVYGDRNYDTTDLLWRTRW